MEVLALIKTCNTDLTEGKIPYQYLNIDDIYENHGKPPYARRKMHIRPQIFVKEDKKDPFHPYFVILIHKTTHQDFSFLKKNIYSLELTPLSVVGIPSTPVLLGCMLGMGFGYRYSDNILKKYLPADAPYEALSSLLGCPLGAGTLWAIHKLWTYTIPISSQYLHYWRNPVEQNKTTKEGLISYPPFFKKQIKEAIYSDKKEILIVVPNDGRGFMKNIKKELIEASYQKVDLSYFITEAQQEPGIE